MTDKRFDDLGSGPAYGKERTWHPSQRLLEQKDGSVIMEMAVGDFGEVRRWLIGWGADAEVIREVSSKAGLFVGAGTVGD